MVRLFNRSSFCTYFCSEIGIDQVSFSCHLKNGP